MKKSPLLYIYIGVIVVLTACGSSRRVQQTSVGPAYQPGTVVTTPAPTRPAPVNTTAQEPRRTPLQQRIDQLLAADITTQTAQVAIYAFDVTANQLLYERNGQQRMRPA